MTTLTLKLRWDGRGLDVFDGGKLEAALARAISKAGGDAARYLRTGSSRLVRQRKRIKAGRLQRGLVLRFPSRGAGLADLAWRMDVSSEAFPAIDYPVRQTKRGVRIQVNVGSSKLIKGAFIARMKSGHRGVFTRERVGGARVRRLPIKEAFSSRIVDVFQDAGFVPFVQAGAQARFESSLKRLLPLELGKVR